MNRQNEMKVLCAVREESVSGLAFICIFSGGIQVHCHLDQEMLCKERVWR